MIDQQMRPRRSDTWSGVHPKHWSTPNTGSIWLMWVLMKILKLWKQQKLLNQSFLKHLQQIMGNKSKQERPWLLWRYWFQDLMAPQKYHGFVDDYSTLVVMQEFSFWSPSWFMSLSTIPCCFSMCFSKIRLCSIWSWSLCHHLSLSSMPDGAFSIPQSTIVSTWYTASSCHPGLVFGHRVETELRLPCMAGRQRSCPSRKKKRWAQCLGWLSRLEWRTPGATKTKTSCW